MMLLFTLPLVAVSAVAEGLRAIPACKIFDEMVHGRSDNADKALLTDQIIVRKGGHEVYSWFDSPAYGRRTLHSLWSASKSVTATLVGAAAFRGDIGFDQKLKELFPATPPDSPFYEKLTVGHLVIMSSGFRWDESYESDPVSSHFIHMLYGEGRRDMFGFARAQAFEAEPGRKFNYSGGNSVLLMGALGRVYGKDRFEREILFDPLGFRRAFIERDRAGLPIGSSYVYMTPDEMADFGQLYLDHGVARGRRILAEDWIAAASQPTSAISRPGSVTPPEYVRSEGVFSDRGFWLNRDVPVGGELVSAYYPHSPRDMYFAAGHYGQMIVILPSQDMVIAITGHSQEYDSKIDRFVSSAVSCFGDVELPVAPPRPPSASTGSVWNKIKTGAAVVRSGTLQAILAKELCSCRFNSRMSLGACLERSGLPLNTDVLRLILNIRARRNGVSVRLTPVGRLIAALDLDQLEHLARTYGDLREVVKAYLDQGNLGRWGAKSSKRHATFLGDGLGCRLD